MGTCGRREFQLKARCKHVAVSGRALASGMCQRYSVGGIPLATFVRACGPAGWYDLFADQPHAERTHACADENSLWYG